MAERRSPKAALRLAQLALETLEKRGRNPELAVDAFISIVRANSGARRRDATSAGLFRLAMTR